MFHWHSAGSAAKMEVKGMIWRDREHVNLYWEGLPGGSVYWEEFPICARWLSRGASYALFPQIDIILSVF